MFVAMVTNWLACLLKRVKMAAKAECQEEIKTMDNHRTSMLSFSVPLFLH